MTAFLAVGLFKVEKMGEKLALLCDVYNLFTRKTEKALDKRIKK